MRVLLDENLDWRLKLGFLEHEVETVASMGWKGLQNGALLKQAVERKFRFLITMDNKMAYQHDLTAYDITVIVLRARTNRLQDTRPLIPAILQAFSQARPGTNMVVE